MKLSNELSAALVLSANLVAAAHAETVSEQPATLGIPTEEIFVLGQVQVLGVHNNNDQIDEQSIRQLDRQSVADAANLLPGITLSKVGARNEQMVYVRGFDLRQVPLFIDGVPVYVPYDGYVDLGRFLTYDLAQISVAKGFSSVSYGPNALGGAINLVTRRPISALDLDAHLGASNGNHSGTSGSRSWLNVGTNQGSWYAQLSGSYAQSDAFSLPDNFQPGSTEDGGSRENSYQEDSKVSAKLALTPNSRDEYAVGYVYQHGRKGTPPYAGSAAGVSTRFWQWPYWDKQSVYAMSNTDFESGGQLRARFYYDKFKNSLFSYDNATYTTITRAYAFKSWYDDAGYGGSLIYDLPQLANHQVRAAVHYKYDSHQEHNAGEPTRIFRDRTESYSLEDTLTLNDSFYSVAGIAYDRRNSLKAQDYNTTTRIVSDFPDNDGHAISPQAGIFMQQPFGTVHLTVARKTRFPTIKDRYSYRLGTAIPNPDLKAENATHYELGYELATASNISFSAALFYTRVQDMIQSVTITASTSQQQNIGAVRNQGAELSAQFVATKSLTLGGNYTWLDRKNLTNPAVLLTDVPDHKVFAYAQWQPLSFLSVTPSIRSESSRETATNGTRRTGGFTLYNLKLDATLSRSLSTSLSADNLSDKLYALNEGFPEAGRTYYLTLNYKL